MQEDGRARRTSAPDVDPAEQAINEAVLDSCHAIGQATAALIGSATNVQKEFNKLVKAPGAYEPSYCLTRY